MTPKTNTSKLQKRYSILFLVLPFLAMADGPEGLPGGTTNVDDTTAPIDNYVLVAMLIGIYLTYRFLKTTHKIKTRN
jgi:hypothetical protein